MVVGELTVETEFVVIGGGPGGHAAACRAAELGIETVIVDDRETLGGSWLHGGCIRSKELLYVADTIRSARHAAAYGVSFDAPKIDREQLQSTIARVVAEMSVTMTETCTARDVTHVRGHARFDNARQLSIAGNPAVPRIRFKRALIATGSRERGLGTGDLKLDHPRVLTPIDALQLDVLPSTLLVLGGSASALEIASTFAALGSRVRVACVADRLCADADDDLTDALRGVLEPELAGLHVGTTVRRHTDEADGIRVEFVGDDAPPAEAFSHVIVATGRVPNVDDLQLERSKVKLDDDGFIVVNDALQTTDPRVFAVGDATPGPMLALKSAHQGRIVAERVAGWASTYDARAVPTVLFTDPQIAWCGLTERDAACQGRPFQVRRSHWLAAGAASGLRRTQGFSKVLYDPDTQLILGVGVVGPNAAELIAEGTLAIEMGAVLTDLAATIHPHPTSSETFGSLARDASREYD